MGRKADLQGDYAAAAAKKLKQDKIPKGRGAVSSYLSYHLRTVPRLQVDMANEPSIEEISNWRRKFLTTISPLFDKNPEVAAIALELLTKDSDFQTGDWLAKQLLERAGIASRRKNSNVLLLLEDAAHKESANTEILLAINDLYAQRTEEAGNLLGAEDQWAFSQQAFLVSRLAFGHAPQQPAARMALIGAILRLPHHDMKPEENLRLLRLAAEAGEKLVSDLSKDKTATAADKEAATTIYLRAGIHLASHLMANGAAEEGRDVFDAFDRHASKAVVTFPESVPVYGARLRLLHKWYKYELVADNDNEIRAARSAFNDCMRSGLAKHGRQQTFVMRHARFERDAGGRSLAYKLITEAIRISPANPYPHRILADWLKQDRFPEQYMQEQRRLPAPQPPGMRIEQVPLRAPR